MFILKFLQENKYFLAFFNCSDLQKSQKSDNISYPFVIMHNKKSVQKKVYKKCTKKVYRSVLVRQCAKNYEGVKFISYTELVLVDVLIWYS